MAKQKDYVTATLDPRWTAPIYQAVSGQDFLGLRAVQANITNYLLPGIITSTFRARYYPFYSWLLVEYGMAHPAGWSLDHFIRRREQVFALANLAWRDVAPDNAETGGLTGSDKLSVHWAKYQDADSVPLNMDNYVSEDTKYAGYKDYTGVMRTLALTRYTESGTGFEVLPDGQALAQAYANAIQDTHYYQHRTEYDTASAISRDVLLEYGARCHLSYLVRSPDARPTLETLFSFATQHILPPADGNLSTLGNMRGTLGMILDLIQQTAIPVDDVRFRECVSYGLCADFTGYQPASQLRPLVAHWQIFQLREYYVYALYALWAYFLRWLRSAGPQTLDGFCEHLIRSLDLAAVAAEVGIAVDGKSLNVWSVSECLADLLDAVHIPGQSIDQRCVAFARQSQPPLQEHVLYLALKSAHRDDLSTYIGGAWLLLAVLFLRLRGISLQVETGWSPWYWARFGGQRRRSLAHFVRDFAAHITAGSSLLEMLRWLMRDYVIAQHTITALEKWRQRNANTFHFNYENGVFEWVEDDDRTGFSASRFRQAYDMLFDLGLYEIPATAEGVPRLTALGEQTLQRILESLNDTA